MNITKPPPASHVIAPASAIFPSPICLPRPWPIPREQRGLRIGLGLSCIIVHRAIGRTDYIAAGMHLLQAKTIRQIMLAICRVVVHYQSRNPTLAFSHENALRLNDFG